MFEQIRNGIRDLYPGYFALVMATGIISLAAHFLEMEAIAWTLFYLNNTLFAVLWALTLARILLARSVLVKDLTGHGTCPMFLTAVAGSCVLGIQYEVLADQHLWALVLWFLGLGLWLLLIYTFFTIVTVLPEKPSLEGGLNGAWLLAVVATQSVSILGTLLSSQFAENREVVLFVTLCLYLLGCFFYLLIITLIFYRFSFRSMTAKDLTPPYWINMGAVAITTMAGARLLFQTGNWKLLEDMRPFIQGFTLFFWAAASWWIPLLLILGDWRHVIKQIPITYHPAYWAMVFPLGMYTAATFQLAIVLQLPFLLMIPRLLIYVALAAWIIVFLGMIASIGRGLFFQSRKT